MMLLQYTLKFYSSYHLMITLFKIQQNYKCIYLILLYYEKIFHIIFWKANKYEYFTGYDLMGDLSHERDLWFIT